MSGPILLAIQLYAAVWRFVWYLQDDFTEDLRMVLRGGITRELPLPRGPDDPHRKVQTAKDAAKERQNQ